MLFVLPFRISFFGSLKTSERTCTPEFSARCGLKSNSRMKFV